MVHFKHIAVLWAAFSSRIGQRKKLGQTKLLFSAWLGYQKQKQTNKILFSAWLGYPERRQHRGTDQGNFLWGDKIKDYTNAKWKTTLLQNQLDIIDNNKSPLHWCHINWAWFCGRYWFLYDFRCTSCLMTLGSLTRTNISTSTTRSKCKLILNINNEIKVYTNYQHQQREQSISEVNS